MVKQQYFFLFGGILYILIGLPLFLQRIKPNGFFGFKVKVTARDPELWYPVNRRAGGVIAFGGMVVIAATFGLIRIPGLSLDYYTMICSLLIAGFLIAAAVRGNALLIKLVNEKY